MTRCSQLLRVLLVCGFCRVDGAVAEPLNILRPRLNEVVQRSGFDPSQAHHNREGGAALGAAEVTILFIAPAGAATGPEAAIEWQYDVSAAAAGDSADTPNWQTLLPTRDDGNYSSTISVPAGGWYQLDIRGRRNDAIVAQGKVERFGVGEVFLIAGQSYAAGTNEERMKIDDPQLRVAAYDVRRQSWQIANDPQPNVGEGGTIWPTMANALLPAIRVPIGLVNVAVSGTSSEQWLPGTPLNDELERAGIAVGKFRAVLWQQGESDVYIGTSTEDYIANLLAIQQHLHRSWKQNPPWLLAKSTFHPTVYDKPVEESRIRTAIDELCRRPGFRPGPDTDVLGGENRGGIGSARHFTAVGQRRAGLLWFAALWNHLQNQATASEPGDGDAEP